MGLAVFSNGTRSGRGARRSRTSTRRPTSTTGRTTRASRPSCSRRGPQIIKLQSKSKHLQMDYVQFDLVGADGGVVQTGAGGTVGSTDGGATGAAGSTTTAPRATRGTTGAAGGSGTTGTAGASGGTAGSGGDGTAGAGSAGSAGASGTAGATGATGGAGSTGESTAARAAVVAPSCGDVDERARHPVVARGLRRRRVDRTRAAPAPRLTRGQRRSAHPTMSTHTPLVVGEGVRNRSRCTCIPTRGCTCCRRRAGPRGSSGRFRGRRDLGDRAGDAGRANGDLPIAARDTGGPLRVGDLQRGAGDARVAVRASDDLGIGAVLARAPVDGDLVRAARRARGRGISGRRRQDHPRGAAREGAGRRRIGRRGRRADDAARGGRRAARDELRPRQTRRRRGPPSLTHSPFAVDSEARVQVLAAC